MAKIQKIEELFLYITIYSYLLIPLYFLFHKEKSRLSVIIAIYCLVAFSLLLTWDYISNTIRYYYFTVYTLVEYSFFTLFIFTGLTYKKLKVILLLFSCCFLIFQLVFDLKKNSLDSISVAVETILLFIFIILFFYDHSQNNKEGFIYNHPVFWLSVGILFYLGGSFFFNILVNYMTKDEVDNFWHYTYFAEIFKNLLFGIAVMKTSHLSNLNRIKPSQIPYLDIDMN